MNAPSDVHALAREVLGKDAESFLAWYATAMCAAAGTDKDYDATARRMAFYALGMECFSRLGEADRSRAERFCVRLRTLLGDRRPS